MATVPAPKLDPWSPSKRFGPREPDRGNRRAQLLPELRVAVPQARLHRRERVAREIPPVAVLVSPGHEENGARPDQCALPPKSAHERVRKRKKLVVLLEDYDVPANIVEEVRQPVIPGSPLQRPVWRRVRDRKDRRGSLVRLGELVHQGGHRVVVREAVADEQDAQPGAIAPGQSEIALDLGEEGTANQARLRQADVQRDGQQQANGHANGKPQGSMEPRVLCSRWAPIHGKCIDARRGAPYSTLQLQPEPDFASGSGFDFAAGVLARMGLRGFTI